MSFLVKKTKHTPYIFFDNGILTLSGRSIPEDSAGFYEPLLNALHSFMKEHSQPIEINILLEYSNSSTNRILMSIFQSLYNYYKEGNSVIVNWYYLKEDNGMYDLGNDFKEISALPFALIEVDDFPPVENN